VISGAACVTLAEEMGDAYSSGPKFLQSFHEEKRELIRLHRISDFTAPIASGSFQVYGMVIVPCSMGTLAAIATGLADNLLRRAADVTLKERRPLIIVPREAPFNEIHLENMLKLSRLGAVILPPVPAWYLKPKSMADVETVIVSKIFDALKIQAEIGPRWNGSLRTQQQTRCEESLEQFL
jgi:polyprenyl P-hydroxybenzoate/phenylacrylic acid decarboxylase-like protein